LNGHQWLNLFAILVTVHLGMIPMNNQLDAQFLLYEGWNFNSGNYLFTTDTK